MSDELCESGSVTQGLKVTCCKLLCIVMYT